MEENFIVVQSGDVRGYVPSLLDNYMDRNFINFNKDARNMYHGIFSTPYLVPSKKPR